MKEEIKKIILNKALNQLDKIISIWKLITDEKNNNFSELSTALEVPEIMLANWKNSNEINDEDKKSENSKKEIKINDYIRIFDAVHKEIFHRGFKFTKKEIGQISYIKKAIKFEVFENLILMISNVRKYQIKGKHIPNNWNYILQNLTPTTIYSKINFFLNELEKMNKKSKDKKSDWEKSGAMIFREDEDGNNKK